jgi:UDPglucose--hexose-1-phosphate uridylyltransferase
MGFFMSKPSDIIKKFQKIKDRDGITAATDYFYHLCRKSDYIRMERIAKNLKWDYESPFGNLEITVNLSKPEKDPREIAALKNAPQSGYPKCLLCPENIGYAGRVNHPARQTHRTIPLDLYGETWHFQYSPYVYYNEHCIVLKEKHVPMKLTRETFIRLFNFIDLFPHYFIGSNADLPIAGGSILRCLRLIQEFEFAFMSTSCLPTLTGPSNGNGRQDLNTAIDCLAQFYWRTTITCASRRSAASS